MGGVLISILGGADNYYFYFVISLKTQGGRGCVGVWVRVCERVREEKKRTEKHLYTMGFNIKIVARKTTVNDWVLLQCPTLCRNKQLQKTLNTIK